MAITRRSRVGRGALFGGAVLFLATAEMALADHGGGLRSGPANPWLAALLWGALGLAVAMVVALVVMIFTRAPTEDPGDERPGP